MDRQGQRPRKFEDRGQPLEYTPGYSIFVWGQGNVRVDVPSHWHMTYADNITALRDKPEPDTSGMIQITVFPPFPWEEVPELSLRRHFRDMMNAARVEILSRGEIHEVKGRDLQMIWQEKRYVDHESEGRLARATTYLARGGLRQVVITCTCWDEGLPEYGPIFEVVRKSVRISDLGDALTGHLLRRKDN